MSFENQFSAPEKSEVQLTPAMQELYEEIVSEESNDSKKKSERNRLAGKLGRLSDVVGGFGKLARGVALATFFGLAPSFANSLDTLDNTPNKIENVGNEKKEKLQPGIHYFSEQAEKDLKGYERLYENLKKVKRPVIIGNLSDLISNLNAGEKANFISDYENITAASFPGKTWSEKGRKKTGVDTNYLYLIYNNKKDDPSNFRTAYHETVHLKHGDELLDRGRVVEGGLLRYKNISKQANQYFEEILTSFETIEWMKRQQGDPKSSVLNEEEKKFLPTAIEMEETSLNVFYDRYYRIRYGDNFDIPRGYHFYKDKIDGVDKKVERMYEKYVKGDLLSKGKK